MRLRIAKYLLCVSAFESDGALSVVADTAALLWLQTMTRTAENFMLTTCHACSFFWYAFELNLWSNSVCAQIQCAFDSCMSACLPATALKKKTVYIKLAIVCLCCFKIENNMTIDRAQIVAQNASGNHFINLLCAL